MIKFILEYIFVFLTGAVLGWCLEVFYRRFFGLAKKWINPGFLSGPFLPLYGSAMCVLYIVSKQEISLGLKIVIFALVTTGFEYFTGLFFLKYYNTRLWDYSNMKFNFQGLIQPLYSLFWVILSLFFYYVLYPFFYTNVTFLYENLEFSLLIGIVLGFVIVDIVQSFDVLNRMKKIARQLENTAKQLENTARQLEDTTPVIQYDLLKMEIRDRFKGRQTKVHFMRPFRGDFSLREQLKAHLDKLRENVDV